MWESVNGMRSAIWKFAKVDFVTKNCPNDLFFLQLTKNLIFVFCLLLVFYYKRQQFNSKPFRESLWNVNLQVAVSSTLAIEEIQSHVSIYHSHAQKAQNFHHNLHAFFHSPKTALGRLISWIIKFNGWSESMILPRDSRYWLAKCIFASTLMSLKAK